MAEVTFSRLFPAHEVDVDAQTYVAALASEGARPGARPLVLSNFVTSLDGNATFQGGSSALSDPGDRALFHALRASAGAILAGTGTLAAEKYRPAGKPIVTVTRSGHLPLEIPAFSEPEGRVIVFSSEPLELGDAGADISVEPLGELPAMLERLRSGYGIDVLLCEGGPGLLGELVRARLVDELFLTLAPKLAGGNAGPGMTSGDPADALIPMTLAAVLEHASTLYLHYSQKG